MKKILVSLLVLALVAPAMADVTVTGTDEGSGVLLITITPSGDAAVRGVALELDTTSGDAAVVASTDVAMTNLNTNIDYFYTNGTAEVAGETPNAEGHPLAEPDVAGVLDLTSPRSNFSLCAGYLDPAETQLGQTAAMTFTVNYDLSSESVVSITEDALRGGIVGDTLGTVTIINPTVTLAVGETCRDKFDATTQALYDRYVDAGADPSSWCWQFQCRGDADNAEQGLLAKVRVGSNDLSVLLGSWNKTPEENADPRADFDHAEQGLLAKVSVGSNDLSILLGNWNKATGELTQCDSYLP